jgi:crotonobetainyl-CoA:carnitine CoA-transferase CaiB-like acyl-CoA transferase
MDVALRKFLHCKTSGRPPAPRGAAPAHHSGLSDPGLFRLNLQSLQGAAAGLRVLDLSRVLAGPYCAQILGDHGASVLKIEPPQGDETRALGPPFVGDSAAYYFGLNRNKDAIALDLNEAAAREVLLRLLADADVLVENFLPGTMEKWGLGYEAVLAERFPRLIYCRVSGFGADGPLGGLPGYDAVLQAMGGVMSINGDASIGATRVGMPVVDIVTGLQAALGVMLALAERGRSGRGQLVDMCLYDTALSLLVPHAANWFASGQVPQPIGSAHPNIAPYDKFATADGEIYLGVVNDNQFRKFCAAVGRAEWAADARFANNAARLGHRAVLKAEIEAVLRQYESEPLCRALMAAGVPAGPVHTVDQALNHPHTAHRRMMVEVEGGRVLGVPVKLSRTPGRVRSAPPAFASDTRAVLGAAGYDAAAIERLIAEGAVHIRPRTR